MPRFRAAIASKSVAVIALAFCILAGMPAQLNATHTLQSKHWPRTQNPFTLKVVSIVSPQWEEYLKTTVADWSASSVLDLISVSNAKGKTCKTVRNSITVCSGAYGKESKWLGIARTWEYGPHITHATVRLNDSFFAEAPYDSPVWKNSVMCQEVGHALGLDHQDENFDNKNLGSCMDYARHPDTNQHPNAHDYEMLEQIYKHLDTSMPSASPIGADAPFDFDKEDTHDWGKEICTSHDGRFSLFMLQLEEGRRVYTYVLWADPEHDK